MVVMGRIVLLIEYDGTDFLGSQLQARGRTVQGELERAIRKATGERARVAWASRTDAGVHSTGQVASFKTSSHLSPSTLVRALNYYLPQDAAVKEAREIDEGFDIRRRALSRGYRYTIANTPTRLPLHLRDACWVKKPLRLDAMSEAAQALLGEKDFSSFTLPSAGVSNGRRTIYKAELKRKGSLVTFDIEANSFLRHQVRLIVGALLGIGVGKSSPEEFGAVVAAAKPGLAGPVSPAHGLCLKRVKYGEPLFSVGDDDADL